MAEQRRFPYRIDRKLLPLGLLFGLRPSRDGVRLDGERFVATYGFIHVETPLANIDGAHVTRKYRWWTAVGIRRSFVDDGLTFGTNRDEGVCVHFATKVVSPVGRRGHSALTVTVADVEGLAQALNQAAADRERAVGAAAAEDAAADDRDGGDADTASS
jgi:hypothetical protein